MVDMLWIWVAIGPVGVAIGLAGIDDAFKRYRAGDEDALDPRLLAPIACVVFGGFIGFAAAANLAFG